MQKPTPSESLRIRRARQAEGAARERWGGGAQVGVPGRRTTLAAHTGTVGVGSWAGTAKAWAVP